MQHFVPVPIEPIPIFAALRQALLEHDDPKRRWPKWQFIFAPDLAIQIQPRADVGRYWRVEFRCIAIQGPEPQRHHFRGYFGEFAYMRFDLARMASNGELMLVPTGYRGKLTSPEFGALRDRVIAALRPTEVGEVKARLLSYRCLICSKGLTDPISMARLIGPECAQEYDIPTIRQIEVATSAAVPPAAATFERQADLFAAS